MYTVKYSMMMRACLHTGMFVSYTLKAGVFVSCGNLDGKHHSLVEIGEEPPLHMNFYCLVEVAVWLICQCLLFSFTFFL